MQRAASVAKETSYLNLVQAGTHALHSLRGEAHDLGAWLVKNDASEGVSTSIVSRVWSFASSFARRAHVEWRIAIAKLGGISPEELDGELLFFSPSPIAY